MESINPVWLFSGIALVIGFLLGAVIQMLFNPNSGDIDKLKSELEQTRSELERYKANVNRHFNKTSEMVNELTQDYVKVYQHLAEGAQNLGNIPEFAQALEQSQGRVLISVEDESAPAEATVVNAEQDTQAPATAQETVDSDTAASSSGESQADAGESKDEAGEIVAKTETDATEAVNDERRDPVIGNGEQDAGGDPPLDPDATTATQDAEAEPAKKTQAANADQSSSTGKP